MRRFAVAMAVELLHAATVWATPSMASLDDRQGFCDRAAQSGVPFQERLGVERGGGEGVVDVVRYAAGHLAQDAQFLLSHDRLLGLAQFVVGGL